MYVGFKTLFYVVRHLDSTASYLLTGLHLGFFRSWPSLYLPSSFIIIIIINKNNHIAHCRHTTESANVKVQNTFNMRHNITCSTDCKYRTAATLYRMSREFKVNTMGFNSRAMWRFWLSINSGIKSRNIDLKCLGHPVYPRNMVCFRYIIVHTLHKGDYNNHNNNNTQQCRLK